MDPSHLFWQGIDPVRPSTGSARWSSTRRPRTPGSTRRPRSTACSTTGSPGIPPSEPDRLGGGTSLNSWPRNPAWDFVAVGRGHDIGVLDRFLQALERVDPDMAVNIEHEDEELDQLEGLRFAADTLIQAEKGI